MRLLLKPLEHLTPCSYPLAPNESLVVVGKYPGYGVGWIHMLTQTHTPAPVRRSNNFLKMCGLAHLSPPGKSVPCRSAAASVFICQHLQSAPSRWDARVFYSAPMSSPLNVVRLCSRATVQCAQHGAETSAFSVPRQLQLSPPTTSFKNPQKYLDNVHRVKHKA